MVKINKKFKVTSQLPIQKNLKKDVELNSDGTLTLRGVASTSNQDLHGDIINTNCIQKMKEKASSLNIHADHIYDIDDVIGAVTNVIPSKDDELIIEFNIIPSVATKVKELLDTGVKLGLSIGGSVKEYKQNINSDGENIGWEILDIDLYEISLTPLPANWDTFGTVTEQDIAHAKCITGACSIIRKSQKNYNEIMNEEELTKSEITEETVINIFNEMAESLKREIIENIKTNIIESLKSEILETVELELEEFKDQIVTEVQDKIKENSPEEETDNLLEVKSLITDIKSLIKENTIKHDEIEENVKKSVEKDLLENLADNRQPEAKKIEKKPSGKSLIEQRTMNRHELASKLANEKSSNPFVNILHELQAE